MTDFAVAICSGSDCSIIMVIKYLLNVRGFSSTTPPKRWITHIAHNAGLVWIRPLTHYSIICNERYLPSVTVVHEVLDDASSASGPRLLIYSVEEMPPQYYPLRLSGAYLSRHLTTPALHLYFRSCHQLNNRCGIRQIAPLPHRKITNPRYIAALL